MSHNSLNRTALNKGSASSQNEGHHAADEFVDTVSAAMPPPGLQERREKAMSADEILKEMNRVPLFMTSLDEDSTGENDMLEAIKALAYEGTRAEVAANFREQGNEAARAKLWTDAREFYSKAIQTLRGLVQTTEVEGSEEEKMKVVEVDEEAEAQKERELEEASLANRALCNLEMKNYASTNSDCAACLRLNPRNVKAWYRASRACLALDKIPEALDACDSGLKFDPSNTSLSNLRPQIEARRDYLARLQRERIEREERARSEKASLTKALRERGIVTRETKDPPDLEDAVLSLDAESNELSFPVLFLYPLHAQTDLIKAVREGESLGSHLGYILPVPWDEKGEYAASDKVECYMETAQGGLIKAGKKVTLAKLLGGGKVEVVDGLVRVFVVPKDRTSEWIEEFKKRRGKS